MCSNPDAHGCQSGNSTPLRVLGMQMTTFQPWTETLYPGPEFLMTNFPRDGGCAGDSASVSGSLLRA